MAAQASSRDLAGRGEQRERNRQVERGAFLLELSRRQVDGDAAVRPLQFSGANAAPDALLCFLNGTIRETDDRQRGSAALDVSLDLDPSRLEADKRKGDRTREHLSKLCPDL